MTTESIEIVQNIGKGKRLCATLLNERELNINDATKRKTIKYSVDIVALNNESQRKIILGWQWFAAGIAVILATFIIPAILQVIFNDALYKMIVYSAGTAIGAGCFFMAWRTTATKQIFFSRNSNVPLVELFCNQPSKNEFNTFAKNMEQGIRAVQQKMDLSLKNQLAGEMKMLRRLNKEGVLGSAVYEKAKDDLLSKH
jgi:hypothetical protein